MAVSIETEQCCVNQSQCHGEPEIGTVNYITKIYFNLSLVNLTTKR